MSQNTHIGAANDRRPVNHKNIKKRRKQHEAVLSFLHGKAEQQPAQAQTDELTLPLDD